MAADIPTAKIEKDINVRVVARVAIGLRKDDDPHGCSISPVDAVR